MFCRNEKNTFFLLVTLTMSGMFEFLYNKIKGNIKKEDIQPRDDNVSSEPIVLTIRMTLMKKVIGRLFCFLLRSAVLFWNPNYGDVVIILDEVEKVNFFLKKLNSLRLPFCFRLVYVKLPNKTQEFIRMVKEHGRPYGRIRMIYSSFLID